MLEHAYMDINSNQEQFQYYYFLGSSFCFLIFAGASLGKEVTFECFNITSWDHLLGWVKLSFGQLAMIDH